MNGISIKQFARSFGLVVLSGAAFLPPCHAADDWPTYRMPAKPADMPTYEALVGIRASFDRCLKSAAESRPLLATCIDTEYDYQLQRLQRNFRLLKTSFDKDREQQLQDEEKRWTLWRDSQCSSRQIQTAGDGCRVEITADRATQLEYRVVHRCYRTRCGRNLYP